MNNDTKEMQYSLSKILAIWALASLPGALLFWLGLPFLDEHTQLSTTYLVLIVLVIPYVWQLILSLLILKHENGKLRWDIIK
ncbi:MAG TPA: hypothetical protein VKP08_19870, partial [Anaerolineales bacterium]|nr:hypothetical protein [Anaerolineales bacterium]